MAGNAETGEGEGLRTNVMRSPPQVSNPAYRPVSDAGAYQWREVRVFISSTFQDMDAERDHLVRFVFPRLRTELVERRFHLVDGPHIEASL